MTNMLQQRLDTFSQLNQTKNDLVEQLAEAEVELTDRKLGLAREKKQLDQIRDAVIADAMRQAGDKWGSNEDKRKASAALALSASRSYVEQEKFVASCEEDVKRQEDYLSDLNRRYGAVCYEITHHSALLQFVAVHIQVYAPAPVGGVRPLGLEDEVQFMDPKYAPVGLFGGNGSTISPADAEQIGL